MGKCSDEKSKPYKFTLQDLQDLKVGETLEMARGCGPDVAGEQPGSGCARLKDRGFGWPENGEFAWGGLGQQCGLCSDVANGYGCECSGGESVIGKRGTVIRRAFLADKDACCLANAQGKYSSKTVDNKTCDYDYRDPTSPHCTGVIKEFCLKDTNLINDAKCKALNTSHSSLYKELMKGFCNANSTNANHTECITYCKNNSTDCHLLNTLTDCAKYGLCKDNDYLKCDSTCTPQAVLNVKQNCKKYGIESEQGLQIYGCSVDGIKELEAQCTANNVDLSICSPIALQDAKQNALGQQQLNAQLQAKEQSQKNYEDTYKTIEAVLGKDDTLSSQSESDTSSQVLIFGLVSAVVCCCILFSGSVGIALSKRKGA